MVPPILGIYFLYFCRKRSSRNNSPGYPIPFMPVGSTLNHANAQMFLPAQSCPTSALFRLEPKPAAKPYALNPKSYSLLGSRRTKFFIFMGTWAQLNKKPYFFMVCQHKPSLQGDKIFGEGQGFLSPFRPSGPWEHRMSESCYAQTDNMLQYSKV